MAKNTKTSVVEIHFCEDCNKQTQWTGLDFHNIGGFEFIACDGCGICSVEGLDEEEYESSF